MQTGLFTGFLLEAMNIEPISIYTVISASHFVESGINLSWIEASQKLNGFIFIYFTVVTQFDWSRRLL